MARQVRIEVIADATKYTRGMREAQRTTGTFEDHTKRAGSSLRAAFATFSAGAVIVGLKKTVDAASAMNETISKTKVVFGPAAKQVEAFAATAAKSMGLSRQEALESAATFGNLFVSMKIGAPKAAEMSTQMVKLAGDLASFNNANPQETLEALRSGLVGETEPLRRFGINLNDADLRQRALQLGLVKTTKEVLPPAIKAQASYSLIMEQSKTAQGDFARTSGGLANQQRILAAQFKDLQANVGNVLLPAMLKGVGIFNDFLGVVDRNRKAFGILGGVVIGLAGIVGGLLAVQRTVKAVTEAWGIAQVGLNKILGITKAQAAGTAVAESALATSTAASGAAAGGASLGFSRLTASLGPIGVALAAIAIGFQVATTKARDYNEISKNLTESTKRYGLEEGLAANLQARAKAARDGTTISTRQATGATQKQALETAYAAKQTEAQRLEMVKAVPAFQSVADKATLNAAAIKDLSAKLAEARGQFAQERAAMAQTIISYDGLISKSKTTAAEVIKDIRNQVANFKTYAVDTQRLIRAGVNPAAIQELSQKGPAFVHALATGTNAQLQTYKSYWAQRQAEVKGSFTASLQAQLVDLQKKIRAMQTEINKLKGKTVGIKVNWDMPRSGLAGLTVAIKGGPLAKGGRLPGYGGGDRIPAMLEAGEAVVPKHLVSEMAPWAASRGIPGFQGGGFVGTLNYFKQMQRDMTPLAHRLGMAWGRVLQKLGGGSPAIKSFIRSTDPLPYVWGAAGPGGYDCSGLVSAVLGKMTGRGGGHGQRYFTTSSIRSGILGIKPGLGGTLQIGVTPARGHMAGRYGGLGFEAESTRTGIKIGTAASRPEGFARHFHLAEGGLVGKLDPRTLEWLARQRGISIGGDPGKLRIERFDGGGYLRPGLNLAYNGTGRPERVGGGASVTYEVNINVAGSLIGSSPRELADALLPHIRAGQRTALRREGKTTLAQGL